MRVSHSIRAIAASGDLKNVRFESASINGVELDMDEWRKGRITPKDPKVRRA